MKFIPWQAVSIRFHLWLLTLLLPVAGGCNRPAAAPPGDKAAPAANPGTPTVKTVKPERKTIHRTIEQPGEIQAFEQTPVYAKIPGYVAKVNKDIGDRVRQGEILAELWVPEVEEELKRKQALVQQADAEIRQAQKTFTAAGANVESARARVKEAEAHRLHAVADLERAKSQYDRLKTKATQ